MRKFGFGILLCAAIVSPTVFSFQAPGGDARPLAGQPLIVALNKYDNSISFVDPRRGFRVVSTIATCVEPHEVSLSPDGRRGYVGCAGGNEVAVVDVDSMVEVKRIKHSKFAFPHGSAVTPDGRKVYLASTRANTVFVIDAQTLEVTKAIPTGQNSSHMVAITRDGKWAFIPNIGSRSVSVIDVATDQVVDTIAVGNGPEGIAITPDDRTLLIANQEDNTVSFIDIPSRKTSDVIGVGDFPVRVVVSPDGKRAYTADRRGNTVSVIDIEGSPDRPRRRMAHSVPVGNAPGGMTFLNGPNLLVVSNNNDNTLVVVETRYFRTVAVTHVGTHPDGIIYRAGAQPGQAR